MAGLSVEFPVGGLLNGDSYKTSTRMKNISSAMNWIQKQLEAIRDSDKQLLDLFQKLETDMSELKIIYIEGSGRGRNSSVSSMRDLYIKTSLTTSQPPFSPATLAPPTSKVSILDSEATATLLEHSDSNDSLADFADELGFDDDDDKASEDRPSIKSQSSNDLQPATSSHSQLHEDQSSLDYYPRDSEKAVREERVVVRRLSNDSGAVADSDSTGSNMAEGKKLDTLPSLSADDEKRLSGFADEIFKMFQLSNS